MPTTREAVVAALPVTAAVGVFGISYGVFARAAGVPAWAALAMSVGVFAGSAQFAYVGVVGAGGSPVAAAVSGLLLNLRYLATGAGVAPVLPRRLTTRLALAHLTVDESYALAVAAGAPGPPDRHTLAVAGILEFVLWNAGSAAGVALGPVLGDPVRLGLDAAFPALFVALLWPLLGGRATRAAVAGALTALVLSPVTPAGVPIAAAAVAGLVAAR